jgi:hypothetical protein
VALLFPEKEAKSVVLLRRKPQLDQTLALELNSSNVALLFPEKEAKSVVLLRRRPHVIQISKHKLCNSLIA